MKNNKIFIAAALVVVVVGFVVLAQFYSRTQSEQTVKNVSTIELIKDYNAKLGPDEAKVKMVEFLDPECEACRAMAPIVKQLMKEYDGQIQLIIRYMPLHGNSLTAAIYLEEAREKGLYWEAMNSLFENQPAWADHHAPKPELIPKFLVAAGVKEAEKFEENILLSKHRWKVEKDQADGRMLGVQYTPTFFINGKMLNEIGYEPLKKEIEAALAQ